MFLDCGIKIELSGYFRVVNIDSFSSEAALLNVQSAYMTILSMLEIYGIYKLIDFKRTTMPTVQDIVILDNNSYTTQITIYFKLEKNTEEAIALANNFFDSIADKTALIKDIRYTLLSDYLRVQSIKII